MKTRLLLIILAVSFAFASCGNDNDSILTVISYNIRQGAADDGENSWMYRRPATRAMIEDCKPDIFGVQEAYPEQLQYISEHCKDYNCIGVGREDGDKEGEQPHGHLWNMCRAAGNSITSIRISTMSA